MPDDKNKKHLDSKRIDINDPKELGTWSKVLNQSQKNIIETVEKLNTTSAQRIKNYFEETEKADKIKKKP